MARWFEFMFGGRKRHEPQRATGLYPRLMAIGGQLYTRDRPLIKPTPANLRRFSKSPYARRVVKTVKDPIATLAWEIAPKEGVKLNLELQRQIDMVSACFKKPNHDDSFSTLVEQIVEDMLVCGAGAIEHQLGGDPARPIWMWPTDAMSIQVFAGWDGDNAKPRYWQSLGYGNVGGTQGKSIRNDELVFIRVDPSTESPFGTGAIEIAFNTINRLLGAQDFAGNVASNAHPENVLFFKGADPAAINSIRQFWQDEVEGQGKVPLFGGDAEMTVAKLRGATDDALFLKWQEVLIRELCAAAGVSPQNVGIEKDVNRNTAEVSEDRDWRMTIVPLAKRVALYVNREIIDEKLGFSQIEFKWLGLERDDEQASAEIYETRYKNNMITPNEERGRLNMPPMDGPWGDMTFADMQIAVAAARGAAQVDDDSLEQKPGAGATPKPGRKAKRQGD